MRRKTRRRPDPEPWVVNLVEGVTLQCSACSKEISKPDLRSKVRPVKLELVALADDEQAVSSGCKFELKYKGERFGIRTAYHQACLG